MQFTIEAPMSRGQVDATAARPITTHAAAPFHPRQNALRRRALSVALRILLAVLVSVAVISSAPVAAHAQVSDVTLQGLTGELVILELDEGERARGRVLGYDDEIISLMLSTGAILEVRREWIESISVDAFAARRASAVEEATSERRSGGALDAALSESQRVQLQTAKSTAALGTFTAIAGVGLVVWGGARLSEGNLPAGPSAAMIGAGVVDVVVSIVITRRARRRVRELQGEDEQDGPRLSASPAAPPPDDVDALSPFFEARGATTRTVDVQLPTAPLELSVAQRGARDVFTLFPRAMAGPH